MWGDWLLQNGSLIVDNISRAVSMSVSIFFKVDFGFSNYRGVSVDFFDDHIALQVKSVRMMFFIENYN